MKRTPQTSETGSAEPGARTNESSSEPALPQEIDESPQPEEEGAEPRPVGKRAYRDERHGLEDTDRRGGGEYQKRTQSDENANSNSATRNTK
ncbi:hypothetical protein [Paraburkholderia mimosarum]|uniref:hypothetical protein n=1 Tax=Paraburkholderia mimosarum TaxID=312026 RepID=UPI0004895F43|nr:hypothetical protein [Paraburkholderia mimosarum]